MYYVILLIEMSAVASPLLVSSPCLLCYLKLLLLHWLPCYSSNISGIILLYSFIGVIFPAWNILSFTWFTPKPLGNLCGNVTISVRNSQIILFKTATLSATQYLLSLPCFIFLYSPQYYPTSCTFYLFIVCFHH